MLIGKHYIAGNWIKIDDRFSSQPVTGKAREFCIGTPRWWNRLWRELYA